MDDHDDIRSLESILDAFDADDPARALDLARRLLVSSEEEDPVLHFFAGRALLELDRADEAVEQLARAVALDPDDADYRSELAVALFRCCRFDEAETEVGRALDADPARAEDHELLGMLRERQGRLADADRHFRKAATLDPDGCAIPLRLADSDFERVVRRAAERLPEEFRRHLDDVSVTVEPVPSYEVLTETDPPMDPGDLLGLFVGVALPDRVHDGPGGDLPPRILLFQRNLERYAASEGDLEEQISITLYHELGHYLGLDEEQLERIDLG